MPISRGAIDRRIAELKDRGGASVTEDLWRSQATRRAFRGEAGAEAPTLEREPTMADRLGRADEAYAGRDPYRITETDGPDGPGQTSRQMISPHGTGSATFDTLAHAESRQGGPLAGAMAEMAGGGDDAAMMERGKEMERQQQSRAPMGTPFIDNYNVSMQSDSYMSPMQRRQAAAEATNTDRRMYLMMRRAYRNAYRQARGRRGSADAALQAASIFQSAADQGMNLSQAFQGQRVGYERGLEMQQAQTQNVQTEERQRQRRGYMDLMMGGR